MKKLMLLVVARIGSRAGGTGGEADDTGLERHRWQGARREAHGRECPGSLRRPRQRRRSPQREDAEGLLVVQQPQADTPRRARRDADGLAHSHRRGGCGRRGSRPVRWLFARSGCTTTTKEIIDAILANPSGYYVNVHNASYPGGAIRGQLKKGAPA